MGREVSGGGEVREVRLEGGSLIAAGIALAALLFGAFELGRAFERRHGASGGGPSAETGPGQDADPQEAPEKPTFFDTVSGAGKEAEPKREASRPSSPSPPVLAAPTTPGPWFVQVFVGRDRQAAEEVVRGLREKGYPVRTDAVSEGRSGSLYKVRVGGYPSRDDAEAGARKLETDGEKSTWVVKIGG